MSMIVRGASLDEKVKSIQTVAEHAAASGLYSSVGDKSKIFMILMQADELGIPAAQALNGGLWNIQGKVEISARMVNSMLRRAGISIKIKRLDAKGCVLEGTRRNGDTCLVSFLEEDAIRAGLANRPVWKQHPEDMYFARGISKLARRLAPDVLGTCYVEGEVFLENEANAIKPENLPTTEVEVQEFLELQKDAVQTFVDGQNDPLFKQWFEAVRNAYKKTEQETIDLLSANPDETTAKFAAWKERQVKA